MNDNFVYNNEEESEMGQLHAIHLHLNAVAAVRRNMPTGPGQEDCEDCGEKIPLARRAAVPGCIRCITCQGVFEFRK